MFGCGGGGTSLGGLGIRIGPSTGRECIGIPASLHSRYPNMGSMPNEKSSIAN